MLLVTKLFDAPVHFMTVLLVAVVITYSNSFKSLGFILGQVYKVTNQVGALWISLFTLVVLFFVLM